jgi:hypothetical protein
VPRATGAAGHPGGVGGGRARRGATVAAPARRAGTAARDAGGGGQLGRGRAGDAGERGAVGQRGRVLGHARVHDRRTWRDVRRQRRRQLADVAHGDLERVVALERAAAGQALVATTPSA